jgi:hypothetical protein
MAKKTIKVKSHLRDGTRVDAHSRTVENKSKPSSKSAIKKFKWVKIKSSFEGGVEDRHIWHTTDDKYGLVVNRMAYGEGYHVGYNYISNPNHVTLAENVRRDEAFRIANKFMKETK